MRRRGRDRTIGGGAVVGEGEYSKKGKYRSGSGVQDDVVTAVRWVEDGSSLVRCKGEEGRR